MRAVAGLSAALLVSACGTLQAPDWVTNRLPLEPCGTEAVVPDVQARTCLFDAYRAGRGAELITNESTIEGDPWTTYRRVHENGTVEMFIDATQDRFGSGEWERYRCEELISVAEANAANWGYPEDAVFVEQGCEPLPIP
jgi:hypothetical protein